MKFTATLSAFVAGVITMVSAQQVASTQQDAGVYFTNPILGSVFQANTPYSITWIATNSMSTQISSIELRMGSASNLELIQTITTQSVPLALGKFDWVSFENLTTATSYVLVAKNSQGISYSAYFTIIGQAPGTQSNTTSPAPISTAASTIAIPKSSAAVNSSSSVMMTASASASAIVTVSSSIASSIPSAVYFTAGKLGAASDAMNLKAGLLGAASVIGTAIVIMI